MSLLIETEKTELQNKVENLQREKETCCRLQQSIQQLQAQLSDTQLLLEKEKAKYLSACRQQEVSVIRHHDQHHNQEILQIN